MIDLLYVCWLKKPNIIGGNWTKYCTVARSVCRVNRFELRSSSAPALLALCGRFNQFRSPYSWITMRRVLHKRVDALLTSFRATLKCSKIKQHNLQNIAFLQFECAKNYTGPFSTNAYIGEFPMFFLKIVHTGLSERKDRTNMQGLLGIVLKLNLTRIFRRKNWASMLVKRMSSQLVFSAIQNSAWNVPFSKAKRSERV